MSVSVRGSESESSESESESESEHLRAQSTAPETKSAFPGSQIHKVLRLPRNLHFEVHKVLRSPLQDLHAAALTRRVAARTFPKTTYTYQNAAFTRDLPRLLKTSHM